MTRVDVRFARTRAGRAVAWAAAGHGPYLVRAAHWMTHVEHDVGSPIWGPWIERLGRTFTMIRYDALGTGASDPTPDPPSVEADLDALTAVVDALDAPRVWLLGPSHGASAAIGFAARHPERVEGLVILGGFARGIAARDDAKPEALEYHEALARLVELGWGKRNPSLRALFGARMAPGATKAQADAIQELQRRSCPPARAAAQLRAMAEVDVGVELARVRAPTLVLHARDDQAVPFEEGRRLAAAIEGARLVALESQNHLPLEGEPAFETAFAAIEAFAAHAGAVAPPHLTPKEAAIAELLAEGLDNPQIAARLGSAEKTVRNAVSRIYERLGVEGRPQATVRLRAAGFGAAR
ncbi:MAG: alpha/beta fold hydrolase [Sandaracinaceae bacterium]